MEIEYTTLESDTPGQSFALRFIRFRGSGNGPSIYMQAALHAHEFAGMVALDRLIPRLEQAESEGRLASSVTLVPHANPVGLAQAVFGETLGRFDVNSRLNFNRSFPADAPESLSGRSTAERLKATLLSLWCSTSIATMRDPSISILPNGNWTRGVVWHGRWGQR
jgi:predicted deacylase